jgi:hypothetical protein
MGAKKRSQRIAASLRSAGSHDLARRLIEAFNLEDEIDVAVASWLDSELDEAVGSARHYIPAEAYEDEDASDER